MFGAFVYILFYSYCIHYQMFVIVLECLKMFPDVQKCVSLYVFSIIMCG